MAEALSVASDAIYDHVCTPCEEDGRNAEARNFCKNCAKQFCDSCLTFHDRVLKNHTVHGIQDVHKWGAVRQDIVMEKCGKHADKDLEMYCADHDEIVCTICISVDHRTCKTLKHLPDAAKGIWDNPDFKTLPARSRRVHTKLQAITDTKTKARITLKDSRKNTQHLVKTLRKQFNQMLDTIEEHTLGDLDSECVTLDSELYQDLERCTSMLGIVKKIVDKDKHANKKSDMAAYVGYREDRNIITEAEVIVHEMAHQTSRVVFNPDNRIREYLSTLKSFGSTETESSLDKAGHVYRMKSCRKYKVQVAGDTRICHIQGMCRLPDGNIIIVDNFNQKLKKLDEKFHVVSHVSTTTIPLHICYIANYEVALCGCGKNKDTSDQREVHFIDTRNGGWKFKRNFTVEHRCSGIAYDGNHLYIDSNTCVQVYSFAGQLVKRLFKDTSGDTTVYSLACNSDCVYFSNRSSDSLMTVNNDGQLLNMFRDKELKFPNGICLSNNGNVFVCGTASDTILQVDRKGQKKMSTVARATDGVTSPMAVLFDRYTCSLIVGQASDNILVIQLI